MENNGCQFELMPARYGLILTLKSDIIYIIYIYNIYINLHI